MSMPIPVEPGERRRISEANSLTNSSQLMGDISTNSSKIRKQVLTSSSGHWRKMGALASSDATIRMTVTLKTLWGTWRRCKQRRKTCTRILFATLAKSKWELTRELLTFYKIWKYHFYSIIIFFIALFSSVTTRLSCAGIPWRNW